MYRTTLATLLVAAASGVQLQQQDSLAQFKASTAHDDALAQTEAATQTHSLLEQSVSENTPLQLAQAGRMDWTEIHIDGEDMKSVHCLMYPSMCGRY